MTAALLSSHDTSTPNSPSEAISPSSSDSESHPSLPNFSAILPALESAMNVDSFWGPGHYSEMLSRSQRLVTGIHDLISQCETLETLVSSVPPSPTGLGLRRGHTIDVIMPTTDKSKEIRLKRGRVAKRQARLEAEQNALIMRMAWQCWSAVQLPAEQRMAIRASRKQSEFVSRKRTLTT